MKKEKTLAMLENLYKEAKDENIKSELKEKINALKTDKTVEK